jgi:hypothetical protein
MKKLILLSALMMFTLSCEQMLKDRKNEDEEVKADKNVVLGTVKDSHGCVTSAGYRWSQLRKECLRPLEEGYRLNTIDQLEGEGTSKSVFVVFEDDGNRAELFFPDTTESIIIKKESKDGVYANDHWSLELDKKYSLKKDGVLLYAGAEIEEGQITGDDKEES